MRTWDSQTRLPPVHKYTSRSSSLTPLTGFMTSSIPGGVQLSIRTSLTLRWEYTRCSWFDMIRGLDSLWKHLSGPNYNLMGLQKSFGEWRMWETYLDIQAPNFGPLGRNKIIFSESGVWIWINWSTSYWSYRWPFMLLMTCFRCFLALIHLHQFAYFPRPVWKCY